MERTARSVYLPCGCCFRALVDVERHWVVMTYVCKLIARGSLSLCVLSALSVALTMLDDVNGLSINFFSNRIHTSYCEISLPCLLGGWD